MKVCLHQLFRPSVYVFIPGRGDCRYCQVDEENIKCSGYYPVGVLIVEATEKGGGE